MRSMLLVASVGLAGAISAQGPANRTSVVAPSGDLQAALDAARPGDTVLLSPGATYVGNFVLPARGGTDTRPIVVRTDGPDAVAAGSRMSPDVATRLARVRSPNVHPALATAPGARFWRIELVEFLANRGGEGDVVALGDGSAVQRQITQVPSDLMLDRVYIHGDPERGQKRGVALNAARTTVMNSYIAGIRARGQDSQAIGGWNGPGSYTIENNYLEAAGENIMFGGADPSIAGLTPSDIVIRRNTIAKPLAWRSESGWAVKNLLELKNARNVTIEDNLFERNWPDGQSGYAILFTVRNQDGGCRWCEVSQVTFARNVLRDIPAGFAILGTDYRLPSRETTGIVVRDNLIVGLDSRAWGGDGYIVQMTDRPRHVTFDHNTVVQGESGGITKMEGLIDHFVFTNNVVGAGTYGFFSGGRAPGMDSIRTSLPGAVITGNVIAGADPAHNPPGNSYPSVDDLRRHFLDPARGDFRLSPRSPWVAGANRAPGAPASVLESLQKP